MKKWWVKFFIHVSNVTKSWIWIKFRFNSSVYA